MRYTDDLYPAVIARCQHIKVNGVQCGSPALKRSKFCYFHDRWYFDCNKLGPHVNFAVELPVLEDATSVQTAIMQVMRLMLNNQIDTKKAALLLFGLQTAAGNARRTRFEPEPTQVVIDRRRVRDTTLGDAAWYKEEFVDDGEPDDESGPEAHPKSVKARIDPSKPKPPASVDDLAADEAMHGLKHAITLMDELEAESKTAAGKTRKN